MTRQCFCPRPTDEMRCVSQALRLTLRLLARPFPALGASNPTDKLAALETLFRNVCSDNVESSGRVIERNRIVLQHLGNNDTPLDLSRLLPKVTVYCEIPATGFGLWLCPVSVDA